MIIGFSGYAKSGKDTSADYLVENYGFQKIGFADTLRYLLERVNPRVDDYNPKMRYSEAVSRCGYNEAKEIYPEMRRLLQTVGMAAREIFGEDIWVKALMTQLKSSENYAIADVRFKNEYVAVENAGGIIVRVNREGIGPINPHISETELDNAVFDYHVENDSTLANLYAELDFIVSSHI